MGITCHSQRHCMANLTFKKVQKKKAKFSKCSYHPYKSLIKKKLYQHNYHHFKIKTAMYEEKKKSAERKQTKLPSECQQETKEKKIKAAKLQRENKTDFVKRDYYHNKKIQKIQPKQGLFYVLQ